MRGESIPIRLFLAGYDLTPTMRDINKKFSVRYYLNLVLVDEEERRYFKQQVRPVFYCRISPSFFCVHGGHTFSCFFYEQIFIHLNVLIFISELHVSVLLFCS